MSSAGARLALLLLAFAGSGCVAPWDQGDTPFVLLVESFAFDPPDARVEGSFGDACAGAAYALDPPRVSLVRPSGARVSFEPDVVVVIDRGDSWRANQVDAANQSSVIAMAGGTRHTAFERIAEAIFGVGSSSTMFGTGAPFRDPQPPAQYRVRWSDGVASLDDEPLGDSPVVREMRYAIRDVSGAPVNVTHTLRASYVGLATVETKDASSC